MTKYFGIFPQYSIVWKRTMKKLQFFLSNQSFYQNNYLRIDFTENVLAWSRWIQFHKKKIIHISYLKNYVKSHCKLFSRNISQESSCFSTMYVLWADYSRRNFVKLKIDNFDWAWNTYTTPNPIQRWWVECRGFESWSRGQIFFFPIFVEIWITTHPSGENKYYEHISTLLHPKIRQKTAFF